MKHLFGITAALLVACGSTDDRATNSNALPLEVAEAALEVDRTSRRIELTDVKEVAPLSPEALRAQETAVLSNDEVANPLEDLSFTEIDVVHRKATKHIFDRPALARLLDEAVRAGMTDSGSDDGLPAESTGKRPRTKSDPVNSDKTWSNGVDNRFRMGIADGWPAGDAYLRAIGRQAGQTCSGVRVGRQVIMTAAHCVVQMNQGSVVFYSGLTFTPREDRTQPTQAPFGTRSLTNIWVPTQWWDGSCTSSTACNKFDIAFAVTQGGFPGAGSGWSGYNHSGSAATLGTHITYMNGYPNCGGSDDPQIDCISNTAYGDDNNDCDVGNGSNTSTDSNGQHRELTFKCDGSNGMSGSPIFAEWNGMRAFGVYSQYSCLAAACTGSYVNTMTRLTSAYASVLAGIKASWPD